MSGNDTVYDALYSFGARSFSIWRADDMSLVYDSGDDLARKVAEFRPDLFNSNVKGSDNVTKSKDSRSDDKVKKTRVHFHNHLLRTTNHSNIITISIVAYDCCHIN